MAGQSVCLQKGAALLQTIYYLGKCFHIKIISETMQGGAGLGVPG